MSKNIIPLWRFTKWDHADELFVLQHAHSMTDRAIAHAIGRSVRAVQMRKAKLLASK